MITVINNNCDKMPSSYNIPDLMKKDIEALVKSGYYSSKSDVVKDALRNFLETKPNLRLSAAVELYKDKKLSLGKAAELAGVNIIEFKNLLNSREFVRKVKASKEEMKKADELMGKMK